ncbi:MAG: peptidoglycan editing factor PgeF [Candidatus Marinimicrobia bacterium]|nr:peptidoglycan editing factor PgeF [Candidatus Neomarinimicrobiota bacterium]MCF7839986.1 peptidoglycan editing factor PgeF [Candidatus Neomarinimicrobiota bacterium]MCF7902979.1 peptidoglycan editing factor PgeF [Candidatus Neomarinimicrobiota bacterium]
MIDFVQPRNLPKPDDVLVGMTTRNGGVSRGYFQSLNMGFSVNDNAEHVRTNRNLIWESLKISETRLAKPEQVHSDHLALVQAAGTFPATDALITHEPNIFLTIQTADCLPILIWTGDGEWLAAIHSGWGGTEQGLPAEVIAFLLSGSGYAPDEFFVWIGPGLGVCHFEVGAEFESKFDPQFLEHRNGERYFNNVAAVKAQISGQGIPAENLEVVDECTYCESEKYFSHRRDKGVTGRMLAVIGRQV